MKIKVDQAKEIGQHILSEIAEEVVSVEPTPGTIYIETESGRVYSISVMECEEVL
jgi:hypothetical protein